MRHITPIDPALLSPGLAGPWLVGSEGDPGCRIRACRLGAAVGATTDAADRIYFVVHGETIVASDGRTDRAATETTIFVPGGTRAGLSSSGGALILAIRAPSGSNAPSGSSAPGDAVKIIPVDLSRFEGTGFAYQTVLDRSHGSAHVRLNNLRVQPNAGSPDFHIHAFDQFYLILAGEMRIEVGRATYDAGALSLVHLPAGIVHRNYNRGPSIERHISLLIPEPPAGAILDYAVTIHEREAEIMAAAPG